MLDKTEKDGCSGCESGRTSEMLMDRPIATLFTPNAVEDYG